MLSTGAGEAVFIINDKKLYVPVVTLSKGDNKDFIEQQNKGFQRSIYWNEYKTKEINEDADANVFKYINLDPSFQGVNRLSVMAYREFKKVMIGKGEDYTAGSLLDYNYFKKHYKLVAVIYLNKKN